MRPALALLALLVLAGCARSTGNGLPSNAEATCASCHADHAAAFESSPHARAARSPVFEAMLPRVEASWGSAARARCVSCHQPEHGDDAAITCVSCHAAVGNLGTRDGRLVLDVDAPIMGPFTGANAPHATRTSGLLGSSQLCATCHEVTGPDLFVEHTGTEHASAMAATGAPECAGCHVPAIEDGPVAYGGATRARHDHRFVGLDPLWDGSAEERAAATEASRALLDAALELRVTASAVELENVGAGHAVPTGVAFLRDVWVDLEITRVDGTRETLARVLALGDRPMRGTTPVALPTDADHVEAHRLQPFEVARFALPVGVVHVEARVRARAIREDALEALALEPSEVPVLEVAQASR